MTRIGQDLSAMISLDQEPGNCHLLQSLDQASNNWTEVHRPERPNPDCKMRERFNSGDSSSAVSWIIRFSARSADGVGNSNNRLLLKIRHLEN